MISVSLWMTYVTVVASGWWLLMDGSPLKFDARTSATTLMTKTQSMYTGMPNVLYCLSFYNDHISHCDSTTNFFTLNFQDTLDTDLSTDIGAWQKIPSKYFAKIIYKIRIITIDRFEQVYYIKKSMLTWISLISSYWFILTFNVILQFGLHLR